MQVQLIAHTAIDVDALERFGYSIHREEYANDADELAEFAGRNCYLSFNRPNPVTATNTGYLKNISAQNHESVFEHGSASFYIDASRSVLAELTRHRHLSFSVVSQRYVNAEKLGYHVPPAVRDGEGEIPGAIIADAWDYAIRQYEVLVEYLSGVQGLGRKQAREAARAVLPNMTSSPMVVSGNHRAWKDVLRKRWHVAADAEIRELAGELLTQLRDIAPNTYQDIPDTPFS